MDRETKVLGSMNSYGLAITEGIPSVWHYHISRNTDKLTSLCGKRTMRTSIPASAWRVVTHIGETYCTICEREAEKICGGA